MIKVYCIKDEKGVIGTPKEYRTILNKCIYKNNFYYVSNEDWDKGYTSHVRLYKEPIEDFFYLIAKFPRKSLITSYEWRELRINKLLEE
jgi:hypothetical protein